MVLSSDVLSSFGVPAVSVLSVTSAVSVDISEVDVSVKSTELLVVVSIDEEVA